MPTTTFGPVPAAVRPVSVQGGFVAPPIYQSAPPVQVQQQQFMPLIQTTAGNSDSQFELRQAQLEHAGRSDNAAGGNYLARMWLGSTEENYPGGTWNYDQQIHPTVDVLGSRKSRDGYKKLAEVYYENARNRAEQNRFSLSVEDRRYIQSQRALGDYYDKYGKGYLLSSDFAKSVTGGALEGLGELSYASAYNAQLKSGKLDLKTAQEAYRNDPSAENKEALDSAKKTYESYQAWAQGGNLVAVSTATRAGPGLDSKWGTIGSWKLSQAARKDLANAQDDLRKARETQASDPSPENTQQVRLAKLLVEAYEAQRRAQDLNTVNTIGQAPCTSIGTCFFSKFMQNWPWKEYNDKLEQYSRLKLKIARQNARPVAPPATPPAAAPVILPATGPVLLPPTQQQLLGLSQYGGN